MSKLDLLKQKLAENQRAISTDALAMTGKSCHQAALAYAAMGYQVIPLHTIRDGLCTCRDKAKCKHPGKHPRCQHGLSDATTEVATINDWWTKWPDANVGIATGLASNIVVIDEDPRHGGDKSIKSLSLPPTRTAKTGGGGTHYCFLHPGAGVKVKSTSNALGQGIDTRGDGGYIVAPPSLHQSGEAYSWNSMAPLAECPAMMYRESSSTKEAIPEGGRDNELAKEAGRLRREGKNADEIYTALWDINLARCVPPLPEVEVRRIADSISRYAAGHWIVDYHCTDTGNARLFAKMYGDRLRFDHTRKRWLLWSENCWMPDCDGEIERLAAKLARARHEMALRIEDSDIRGQQAKWSMKSEDAGRRSSLVKLAMCEPPIADSGKEWDNNPWTMGVKNGVLDLRTGSCRPGLQEDRITKQIATIYDPSAVCPRWEKFIAEIFAENAHLITHVQKILGMCLTGDVREQYLFVFHGTGDNGKNVLLDTVMGLMGEYAKSAPPDLLTYKVFDAHPTEIADLCGARLVVASETEENKMLRVALVKNLTGDAILKGRFMRQDYFSFPRTHKLILVTNNRPIVRENSHAIWRRIRLMPFTVTVPSEKQDKELLAKLGDEWPGILNWLIAGCLAWQADGLGLPDEVKEAIAEYREEQDLLSNFIMQYCHYDEDAFTPEIEMFDEYTRWAQETHEKYPLSRNVFLTRMKQLPNVKHEHRGHEKGFVGININISTAGI